MMADTAGETRDSLIRGLLDPGAYPWPVERVELVETHISWVFLAGEHVLKVKRPVHFPFVDHRSLEARHDSCIQEVKLNRRLTTGVYVGVVPITRDGPAVRVDGTGDPVEWGTLMRRLPAERMLDQLIDAAGVPPDLAERLGSRLAAFHLQQAMSCGGPAGESAAEQAAVVIENLAELQPFAARQLNRMELALVSGYVRAFVSSRIGMLERRVSDGWQRDGHGDLRAEHICLDRDGAIQIYDCVEFNDRLRCVDVVSDVAFLTMDLRRMGRSDLAIEIVRQYQLMGIDVPIPLLRYYETHRALVRAKVDCLTIAGEQVLHHPDQVREASEYLDIAFRSAAEIGPLLVVMTGLSGTGKSTVASMISRPLNGVWIRSDVIRRELTGADEFAANWMTAAYTPEWTERTYTEMHEQALRGLAMDRPVVLDATYLDQRQRDRAADLARSRGVRVALVETSASDSAIRQRLGERSAAGADPSAAGVAIYLRQLERIWDDPPAVPKGTAHIVVNTDAPPVTWLNDWYAWLEGEQLVRTALA